MRTTILALVYLASLTLLSPSVVVAGPGRPAGRCQPIHSVPTTITRSGVYCLTRDLSTSISDATDTAIRINADEVVLDLNRHVLDGSPAGISTKATGIRAQDRNNITIRNGTVRGFLFAISLQDTVAPDDDTGGHLVTDVRVVGNTAYGIEVGGRGNRVVNNLVLDTGGASTGLFYLMNGIGFDGPDTRILNNDIISVHNNTDGPTLGITTGGGNPVGGTVAGSIIEGNRISDLSNAAGFSITGIGPSDFPVATDGMVIAGNTMTNPGAAAPASSHGITLDASALCRDNTVFRFSSGIGSCTDGGGNVYHP